MANRRLKITKKEMLEQIDKNVKGYYPECKVKELLLIMNNTVLKRCYKSLQSKQQIRALYDIMENINIIYAHYPSYNLENRLLDVLCKKDPYFSFYRLVREKIYSGFVNDDDIYNYLRTLRKNFTQQNKYKEIMPKHICNPRDLFIQTLSYQLFMKGIKTEEINTYLDVGAGDGMKTYFFAKHNNIDFDNVYALDYTNFHSSDYEKMRNKKINFSNLTSDDQKYPFEDNFFDLTTCFMVLHHAKNLELTLSEINRVTKKNKYFVITEHNNFTAVDRMLADIEHAMYEIVWAKRPNYNFRKNEFMNYYSWLEWDVLIARFGFEWIAGGNINKSVVGMEVSTLPFYAIYRKII